MQTIVSKHIHKFRYPDSGPYPLGKSRWWKAGVLTGVSVFFTSFSSGASPHPYSFVCPLFACQESFPCDGSAASVLPIDSLDFNEAWRMLQQNSKTLKIATKNVAMAKTERDKLNAFWYPSLQSTGAWVRLSEKIEIKQPLSKYTQPAKDFVQTIVPGEALISSVLDQIGQNTFVYPLFPSNLTSVGLTAEWVLFSGGKRFRASRIGRRMVDLAEENRLQLKAEQENLLVASYFGLRLAQQVVEVRRKAYACLQHHYEQALKLESEGMLDKAGRLLAEVSRDEAKREWEAATKEESVAQHTLQTLLGMDGEGCIQPVSALFLCDSLPSRLFFTDRMQVDNYALNQLQLQEQVVKQQTHIARTGYLPNVFVFGKHAFYTHGIPHNFVPRSMVGIGFTWNLFDGLGREKRIRQSQLTHQVLCLGEGKVRDELSVAVDKLYTQLEKARENVQTLNASIALSEELLRMRECAFVEGMATSTEVVDAEILLSKVKVARLAAYYEFDVALMNLLTLCGMPEFFQQLMHP